MKLTDFIRVHAESSTIELPCEVVPGHHSKSFVIVAFEKVAIVNSESVMAKIQLRVCPQCFGSFAYEVSQIGRDVLSHGR